MLRRILFVVGALLTIAVVLFVGLVAFIAYSFSRTDDYPAFLSALRQTEPRTYAQLKRDFSDLIPANFPPGSDLGRAIERMSDGGFTVAISKPGTTGFDPNSVLLTWKRRAGVCLENYSIVILKDDAGRVKNASGDLFPSCL